MPCIPFKSEDGKIVGIACSRGKKQPDRCYVCGKSATILCDAPVGNNAFGKSCDKPMCKEHAHRIGNDNDVCDYHFNEYSIKQAQKNRDKLEQYGWKRK